MINLNRLAPSPKSKTKGAEAATKELDRMIELHRSNMDSAKERIKRYLHSHATMRNPEMLARGGTESFTAEYALHAITFNMLVELKAELEKPDEEV